MGFLHRLFGAGDAGGVQSGPASPSADPGEVAFSDEFDVPHELPDMQWAAESRAKAQVLASRLVGSPENFGEAAKVRYEHQGFGVAAVLYGKAVDSLHTQYLVLNMQYRQPGPADTWIVDGFTTAVGASLSMHSAAGLDEEVREATHRLRTIATMCERVGAPSFLYRNALDQLASNAPRVKIDDVLGA
jgi:hypothetical protein